MAVELAEKQLELNQGRRLYYIIAALLALMLAVTIYEGDWLWVGLCLVFLGFFVWWLLVGQGRRTATLRRAIEENQKLVAKPAKRERARRKR